MYAEECRNESHAKVDKHSRNKQILEAMGDDALTAREILAELPYSDMNAVRPRLTEMCHNGFIEEVGKKWDYITERYGTVYKKVED